jgi:hypothetical protein
VLTWPVGVPGSYGLELIQLPGGCANRFGQLSGRLARPVKIAIAHSNFGGIRAYVAEFTAIETVFGKGGPASPI